MQIKNYLNIPAVEKSIHNGEGLVKSRKIFGAEDFATQLSYVAHTELPPGTSFGFHTHTVDREEIYVIESGHGRVQINDKEYPVTVGDVILTGLDESHALYNDSAEVMKVFVFWVAK
ncbi:cupin domain-containing protein [Uliginosibacterium gangwonense]|uniref:cupin domain-containing protein n=1 Tax=Uliginosibacterium gangwonense TaxID=392736 RepID=UPI00037D3123|nr:cupin domain-containing protein [Uliginosibacterium gangwonense]